MGGWPYNEDDFMEIGDSGWVPVGEGSYLNKYTRHTIDQIGREYDENGKLIEESLEDDEQH
jgi:hypothetical protein